MLILVTMRMVDNAGYPERRDALSHDWSRMFAELGVTPLLVPNALGHVARYLDLEPKGLLLTGGDNLGSDGDLTMRDSVEAELLAEAATRRMPVFGVCRGLQMINRYFGGSVERHLPEVHVGEHDVGLSNGRTLRINSFHEEGVVLGGVAAPLEVFAATSANVVEGVRHPDLPITAIQWHPERPSPSSAMDRELLQEFLAQCA